MNKLELITEVLVDELKIFHKDVECLKQSTDSLKYLHIEPDTSRLTKVNRSYLKQLLEHQEKVNEANSHFLERLTNRKEKTTVFYKAIIIILAVAAISLSVQSLLINKKYSDLEQQSVQLENAKNRFQDFIVASSERKNTYLKWLKKQTTNE